MSGCSSFVKLLFHEVKQGNENDGKAFFEESSKQESNNNARHVNEHTTYYVL
jgi:hypothetical protein